MSDLNLILQTDFSSKGSLHLLLIEIENCIIQARNDFQLLSNLASLQPVIAPRPSLQASIDKLNYFVNMKEQLLIIYNQVPEDS